MSWLQTMRRHWREDHPAIVTDEGVVTYGDLDARLRRAAGWIAAQGLGPGDVLALQMPRCLAFLELHLAALGTGVTTLPLNPAYTAAELRYYLDDASADLAVVLPDRVTDLRDGPTRLVPADEALRQDLDEAPPRDLPEALPPRTTAVLLYTSGTTGRPKGAVLQHQHLAATVEGLHEAWRWSADDVLLHALPLFHVHGLFVGQHGALRAGATARWLPRFDAARVLEVLGEGSITVFMGVPTFYARLLALPAGADPAVDHIRLFTSGSAPLPARDHTRFQARFGHAIVERYGMTEIGIVLTNPYDGERRPGTVGGPVPGARVRIVDPDTDEDCPTGTVGEVRISGPSVFAGYLGRPQKTAEALRDGWMCTGDLGFLDDDGYVHLVGRAGDMIISGGLNVYPSETEGALLEHPGVAAAAVVGVPHPDLGERVVASVVPADGREPAPDALVAWCRERLAPYKCPKAIAVVDALPRNTMGKVRKEVLRQRWARLHVRAARPDEAEAIAGWNVDMAAETEGMRLEPDETLRGAREALEGRRGTRFYRAELAGEPVGQCMVTVEWSDWRAREVWWFQSVYVPPAWRRRGIFRALYRHVEQQARAAGAAGLRLYVDRRNVRAQAVYEALGMTAEHYVLYEAMFDEPPSDPDFPGTSADGTLDPEAP